MTYDRILKPDKRVLKRDTQKAYREKENKLLRRLRETLLSNVPEKKCDILQEACLNTERLRYENKTKQSENEALLDEIQALKRENEALKNENELYAEPQSYQGENTGDSAGIAGPWDFYHRRLRLTSFCLRNIKSAPRRPRHKEIDPYDSKSHMVYGPSTPADSPQQQHNHSSSAAYHESNKHYTRLSEDEPGVERFIPDLESMLGVWQGHTPYIT